MPNDSIAKYLEDQKRLALRRDRGRWRPGRSSAAAAAWAPPWWRRWGRLDGLGAEVPPTLHWLAVLAAKSYLLRTRIEMVERRGRVRVEVGRSGVGPWERDRGKHRRCAWCSAVLIDWPFAPTVAILSFFSFFCPENNGWIWIVAFRSYRLAFM